MQRTTLLSSLCSLCLIGAALSAGFFSLSSLDSSVLDGKAQDENNIIVAEKILPAIKKNTIDTPAAPPEETIVVPAVKRDVIRSSPRQIQRTKEKRQVPPTPNPDPRPQPTPKPQPAPKPIATLPRPSAKPQRPGQILKPVVSATGSTVGAITEPLVPGSANLVGTATDTVNNVVDVTLKISSQLLTP